MVIFNSDLSYLSIIKLILIKIIMITASTSYTLQGLKIQPNFLVSMTTFNVFALCNLISVPILNNFITKLNWTDRNKYGPDWFPVKLLPEWGCVAQWVARLTRDWWIPVSREFEPHQRPPLFTWARNVTLIASYWLFPETDSSVIYMSKKLLDFTIEL